MAGKNLKVLSSKEYLFLEDKTPQGIYDRKTREKLYWIIAKLEEDPVRCAAAEKKMVRKFKKADFGFLLKKGSRSRGVLNFDGVLKIDGRFEGKIKGPKQLIIGETGNVTAKVSCGHFICRGTLRGNVVALEKAELFATGRLQGDIKTPSVFIEEGAVFKGKCNMTRKLEKTPRVEKGRLMRFFSTG